MTLKLTGEETAFAIKTIKDAKKKGVHLLMSDVLSNYCLLGAGLELRDATLRTGNPTRDFFNDGLAAEDTTLISDLGEPPVSVEERDFIKKYLIAERLNGHEVTVDNVRQTFDLLGTGFPLSVVIQQKCEILEQDEDAAITSTSVIMKRPSEDTFSWNMALSPTKLRKEDAQKSAFTQTPQKGKSTIPPLTGQQHSKPQERHPTATTAMDSYEEKRAAEFNAQRYSEDNTIRTCKYVHNPSYNTAHSGAELCERVTRDCITWHKDRARVKGPLYNALFGNYKLIMGSLCDNDDVKAPKFLKDTEVLLKSLVAEEGGLPQFYKHMKDNDGWVVFSEDPYVKELQNFALYDLCRKALRNIIIDRGMVWINNGHPAGSINSTAINAYLKTANLHYMVLEYNEDAGRETQRQGGAENNPRGRGGRGRDPHSRGQGHGNRGR